MGWMTKHVVDNIFKPELKKLGYKKMASTFFRHYEDMIYVINVQSSMGNSSDEERFYINCGIYCKEMAMVFGEEVIEKPKEYYCHYRYRYEYIVKGGKPWFTITEDVDIDALYAELADISVKVDDYFKERPTIDDVLKHTDGTREFEFALKTGRYVAVENMLKNAQQSFVEKPKYRDDVYKLFEEYRYKPKGE